MFIIVFNVENRSVHLLTAVCFLCSMGWFDPARLYDIFAEVLSVLNIFALGLCVFFTIKGIYFPSTSDSGSNGSLIYDFWWGVTFPH